LRRATPPSSAAGDFSVGVLKIKDSRLTVGHAGHSKPHTYEDVNIAVRDLSMTSQMPFTLDAKTPVIHASLGDNLCFERKLDVGTVDKAFAEADFVIEHTYYTQRAHQGYLEPQTATASWDAVNQSLAIWVSAQGQFYERQHAAEVLGLPIHKVKVTTLEVGGGFGAKFGLVAPLVGLVSMKIGLPVSHIYTRHEELQASNPAPGSVITIKTGCKKDGTLTALQAKVIVDTGAYSGSPMSIICIMLGAPYKFPNVLIDGYEVLTNKQSVAAYRAPGGPNSASSIEQQIDIMAKESGMSPLDFRMHNASEEGYIRPDGTPQPKIGLKAVLEAVKKHPIWKQPLGPNQGRGLAIGGWGGGRGPSSAIVKLDGDGTFEVIVGTVDLTGSNTSFAQIAADTLGVPTSKIRVRRADTDTAPFGPAAGGSQGVAIRLPRVSASDLIGPDGDRDAAPVSQGVPLCSRLRIASVRCLPLPRSPT